MRDSSRTVCCGDRHSVALGPHTTLGSTVQSRDALLPLLMKSESSSCDQQCPVPVLPYTHVQQAQRILQHRIEGHPFRRPWNPTGASLRTFVKRCHDG